MIRKVQFKDLVQIYFLEQRYFPDNLKLYHSIINFMFDSSHSYVYELNNNIIGFITAENIKNNELIIHTLCVDLEHSNKGIGKQLLEKCIKESNCDISLMVNENNKIAIKMYEKVGFTVEKKVKRAYFDGSDGFIMKRLVKDR